MKITGSTTLTGIFGFPVRHTFSPAMQNAAFEALGLDFAYLPFEVKPADLGRAVSAVRFLGLRGVNVTIPHKEKVITFLDWVDPLARKIGAVNTIVNAGGILKGYNTDATGFLKDLKDKGFNPRGKTAVVAGAGGAGKAITAALSWAGAKRIIITDMSEGRARTLAGKTKNAEFTPFKGWKKRIAGADLLVNATPAGMRPGTPLASSAELRKQLFVYDVVYNRPTELLREAAKAGAKRSGGLGMLLNQGAAAFELWTGRKSPARAMEKALLGSLNNL
jgi:shikimate dehydrogenase